MTLLDKLRVASQGSRELDLAVARETDNIWRVNLPPYTTSIDAALTLVPEGCDWAIAHGQSGNSGPVVTVATVARRGTEGEAIDAGGSTPALALCTAWVEMQTALSAREKEDG